MNSPKKRRKWHELAHTGAFEEYMSEFSKLDRELYDAVDRRELDNVKKALEKGANPCAFDGTYTPLLHMACRDGVTPVMEYLVKNTVVDINSVDIDGETALFWACAFKFSPPNMDLINFLIEHGCDLHHRDSEGNTLIKQVIKNCTKRSKHDHHMAQFKKLKAFLVDQGMVVPQDGEKLMKAIKDENHTTMSALIANGADVNHEGNNGRRPLHQAIYQCNFELAAMLIDAGAAVTSTDIYEMTPMELIIDLKTSLQMIENYINKKDGDEDDDE